MLSSHPIAAQPIPTSAKSLSLPSFIIQNLQEKGIDELFPSQAEIVPYLMKERYDHDVCVMSPTGTGKTLAYAIPIVKRLYRRIIPRVRCLVVVPSRDLVSQVKSVFDYLVATTDLKVCSIGVKDLTEEQTMIRDADIIIATPGRLQTHIDSTESFTLQHLEFLVLDEADKLLTSGIPWMVGIFPAIYNGKPGFVNITSTNACLDIATVRVTHVHPKAFENSPPLRRWLFSATLTEHSSQIAQMHLQSPVFFTSVGQASDRKYQFPKDLWQYYICMEGNMRGMALVKLIDEIVYLNPDAKIACFAQTVDACHRLFTTLKLLKPNLSIAEFYGSLSASERANVLEQFEQGATNIVVCSDLMARGLDISAIDTVINYDVPEHIKAYVHRVGRTARGFSTGYAYSIIDPTEKDDFIKMIQKADNLQVQEKIYLKESFSNELISQFKDVVLKLHNLMKQENSSSKKTF